MNDKLKYIIPYLPFGLKVTYKLGIFLNTTPEQKDEMQTKELTLSNLDFLLQEDCSPMLRPLSYLNHTKNFQKTPLELIRDKYNKENEEEITEVCCHNIGGFTLYGLVEDDAYEISMPYWAYEMVFSMHVDIFGLIEQGLATEIKH
jgi:hypothetical protein